MMKHSINLFMPFLVLLQLLTNSCNKDFLDKKPQSNLNVPTTLNDLQLLLDNTGELNRSPAIGEVSADDYFMSYEKWSTQYSPMFANMYVWSQDIFAGASNIEDWNMPYRQVLYANVVIQQLGNIGRDMSNSIEYDNILGSALFLRAWSFFDLAQIFTVPYDSTRATEDLGIPIRLSADINEKSVRASLKETYTQILNDAVKAKSLLSRNTSDANGNRPSKAAAYAFLSRVYLNIRDYHRSGLYADSALKLKNSLLDFNQLDSTAIIPFTFNNKEIIYQNYITNASPTIGILFSQGYSIDTFLYRSYNMNDLRKQIYFSINGPAINKKCGYSGNSLASNGLTTDELFITRAECFARSGEIEKSLSDLNNLMITRWRSGTYKPFKISQSSELLATILLERRKELVMRALRWNDIRRLNKEGYGIVIKRELNGEVYTLEPNSDKYALPIPPDVVSLSGIQQNKR